MNITPITEKYSLLYDQLSQGALKLEASRVKPIFLESKLDANELFNIWNIVDKNNTGYLDKYQFCYAMSLIQQKIDQLASTQNQNVSGIVNNNNNNYANNNNINSNINKSDKTQALEKQIKELETKLKHLNSKQRNDAPLSESQKQEAIEEYKTTPIFHNNFFEHTFEMIENNVNSLAPKDHEKLMSLIEKFNSNSNIDWIQNEITQIIKDKVNVQLRSFVLKDSSQNNYNIEDVDAIDQSNVVDIINDDSAKLRIQQYLKESQAQSQIDQDKLDSIKKESEIMQQQFSKLKKTLLPETIMKQKITFNEFKVKAYNYKNLNDMSSMNFKAFLKDLIKLSNEITFPIVEDISINNDIQSEDLNQQNVIKEDVKSIDDPFLIKDNKVEPKLNTKKEEKIEVSNSIFNLQEAKVKDPFAIINEEEDKSNDPFSIIKQGKQEDITSAEPSIKQEEIESAEPFIKQEEDNTKDKTTFNPFLNKDKNNPFLRGLSQQLEQKEVIEEKELRQEESQQKEEKVDNSKEQINTFESEEKQHDISNNTEEQVQSILYKVKAIYDYSIEDSELKFSVEEELFVLEENEEWLLAHKIDDSAIIDWIPKSYVEKVEEVEEIIVDNSNMVEKEEIVNQDNDMSTNTFDQSFLTANEELPIFKLIYSFETEVSDDNPETTIFDEGSLFYIMEREDPDWWLAKPLDSEEVYYLPANYLVEN